MSLGALKFLHLKRHILFHGHEPLDTDSTHRLEGESWLMHHGYAQAEGVGSLVGVPATGFICPPSTRRGVRIGQVPEAPLRRYSTPLHWDSALGMRVR